MSKNVFKRRRLLRRSVTFTLIVAIISSVSVASAAPEDIVVFTDDHFKQALLDAGADTSLDGEISEGEMAALTGSLSCALHGIEDITGIEYATGITALNISDNRIEDISLLQNLPALTTIDVSANCLDLAEESDDMQVISSLTASGKSVTYTPQKGVTANPDPLSLCVPDSYGLAEFISPAHAAAQPVTWQSGNPGIASVSTQGVVTAKAIGSTTITMTSQDGNYTATFTVRIVSDKLSSSIYDITGGNLHFAAAGTSAAQLCANMENEYDLLGVFDGNTPYTGEAVATGMTLRLTVGGTVKDEASILVLGDVNGDGLITISDYTLTRLDILDLRNLTGHMRQACDVDGNDEITISDYTLMRLHILDLRPIDGHGPSLPEVTDPQIRAFLDVAHAQAGKPYVWSEEGPDSFDCSGFVYYSLVTSGYHTYRTTADSYSRRDYWTYVEKENLQPGDLMFYFSDDPNDGDRIGHIGIYLGNGYHIHASSSYECVLICYFTGWYDRMFSHGRRVFD